MLTRTTQWIAAAATLAVAAGVFVYRFAAPPDGGAATVVIAKSDDVPQGSPAAAPGTVAPPALREAEPAQDANSYDAEADDGQIAFKADAGGHLVINEKARLD